MTGRKSPTFSIVIPLYNKKEHIKRAIDSIQNQTINDLELIVVNDGSTDNSEKIVTDFEDKRVRLINQSNQGVSAARNKGIEESRGKYIAFLDADDIWKPDFLETIILLIKAFPYAGIYATRYEIVNNNSKIVSPWKGQDRNNNKSLGSEINYFKEALSYPPVSASSVCIPREMFKTYGTFKTGEKYGEDMDMWGRIALHKSVAVSHSICAIYFQDAKNRAGQIRKIRNEPFLETAKTAIRLNEVNDIQKKDLSIYLNYLLKTKSKYHILNGYSQFARTQLSNYKRYINRKSFLKLYFISLIPSFLIKCCHRFIK